MCPIAETKPLHTLHYVGDFNKCWGVPPTYTWNIPTLEFFLFVFFLSIACRRRTNTFDGRNDGVYRKDVRFRLFNMQRYLAVQNIKPKN